MDNFLSNVVFSGDMVLFLFINLGITVAERIIFLYNSKSSQNEKKTQRKNNETEGREEEKNNENNVINKKFFHKNSEDLNDIEISPLKREESKKLSKKEKNSIAKKKKEKILFSPIFIKYVFHFVLLIFFCYFTLILMPTGGTNDFSRRCAQVNGKVQCYMSKTTDYLLGFYFLYCFYFLISSFQIR